MNFKIIRKNLLAICALWIAISCATQEPDPVQVHNDIIIALTDMWDAIEKGDMDRYAEHIHPDFTQFGEYDPVLRKGKEAEIKGISDWVRRSEGIHTEMDDPLVTVKGDVAWIVYYWKDHGITDGEEFATRGKSTRIFVRENGKWLCIHGHYTLLESREGPELL